MAEHRFAWRGIDRDGRTLQGELQAPNAKAVADQLQAQRIRPTRIARHLVLPAWMRLGVSRKVSAQRLSDFTRQFATLLQAGIPLLQALTILQRGESHPGWQALLTDLHRQIEAGLSLHQALRRHAVFDALYCNLVAVGEVTGMLDTLLEREFRAGYAEVAKYGLIDRPDFFAWLEKNWREIFSGGPARAPRSAASPSSINRLSSTSSNSRRVSLIAVPSTLMRSAVLPEMSSAP